MKRADVIIYMRYVVQADKTCALFCFQSQNAQLCYASTLCNEKEDNMKQFTAVLLAVSMIVTLVTGSLMSADAYSDDSSIVGTKGENYAAINSITIQDAGMGETVPSPKKQTKNVREKPNEKNDKYNMKLLYPTVFIPRFA